MDKLNSIAQKLSDKLSTRFDQVFMRDTNADETTQPDQARFFNFIYSNDGIDYGSVTVSINDGKNLKIFFGRNIAHKISPELRSDWYQLLKSLRKFAGRNLLGFDARLINQKLTPKSLKDMSTQDQSSNAMMEGINFGPLKGFRFKSRQKLGPVHIIIRHAQPVDDQIRGSRSRHIDTIFIENPLGERHALPFKKLLGARVMARHVANGGTVNDQIGQFICNAVDKMSEIQSFIRAARAQQNEDASSSQEINEACDEYRRIKEGLNHLRSNRGYHKFKEQFLENEELKDVPSEVLESVYSDRVYKLAQKHSSNQLIKLINYTEPRYLISTILEDIAITINDHHDPLAKFAFEWSRKLRSPSWNLSEDFGQEKLVMKITQQYFKGLNEEIQEVSSPGGYDSSGSNDEVDDFRDWANDTVANIDDDSIIDYPKLASLMQNPITLGYDASDAISAIRDVINDEDLVESIVDLWDETEDWNADARPLVLSWIKINKPALAEKIGLQDQPESQKPEPVKETVGGDPVEDFVDSIVDPDVEQYGDNTMDDPVNLYQRISDRY